MSPGPIGVLDDRARRGLDEDNIVAFGPKDEHAVGGAGAVPPEVMPCAAQSSGTPNRSVRTCAPANLADDFMSSELTTLQKGAVSPKEGMAGRGADIRVVGSSRSYDLTS